MSFRNHWRLVLALFLLANHSPAQTTFNETEPNSRKSEATLVNGIVAGDIITGTSTGTTVTPGLTTAATVDVFRVKTGALPLGIYKHRLTLTTTGSTTNIHTSSIRGLNQTGTPGTASTGGTPGMTDVALQSGAIQQLSPTSVRRVNQWYGFGVQQELYYRVTGSAATTGGYIATLSTSTVAPTLIAPAFESTSPITISTVGQTASNTMIHLFDSNFGAIAGASNDDEGPNGSTPQSRLTRTLPAGTYYMAMSSAASAWNLPAPSDEDILSNLTDFPGSLVRTSSSTAAQIWNFKVSAANGELLQGFQLPLAPALDPAAPVFDVAWFEFTTAPGAPTILPPNDDCTNAALVSPTGTDVGISTGATNDGVVSCGTGGGDVWFSYYNDTPGNRLLSADTCGSAYDTVLSVHNSCTPGGELACSDDCSPSACDATASCVSNVVVSSGQTVLLCISDKSAPGTGGGAYALHTSVVAEVPLNDNCGSPALLTGPGPHPFDTTAATTGAEGQSPTAPCANPVQSDLWFTYAVTMTGMLTVSTCGGVSSAGSDDTIIALHLTGCPAGLAFACNDDDDLNCPGSFSSIVSAAVVCGQVVTIQLGNFSASADIYGSFTVTEVSSTQCPSTSTPFCAGDGTGTACPCGNNGAAINGCANFDFPGGAHLESLGNAGASALTDTLVLKATDIPGPGLFFQGTGQFAAGAGITFGDGLLCAGGTIMRLGVVFPTGTEASYPGGSTPNPVHLAGTTTPGDVRHYQCWYRDAGESSPGVSFCGPSTYNLTQGLTLIWGQ